VIEFMSSHRAELPCHLPPAVALDGVLRYLAGLGYEVKKRSGTLAKLSFPGTMWSSRLDKMNHGLEVAATGATVAFEFSSWNSSYTSAGDREALDARAAAAVSAAMSFAGASYAAGPAIVQHFYQAPAAPPPPQQQVQHTVERQVVVTRCKFCGQLTPVDFQVCQHCGAGKFC
jgi:hypothetical protein